MPVRFALQPIMAASLAIAFQAGHAQPARAADATADFAPLADHHQHLLSPAAAARVNRPLLPEIKVPASIAQILKHRADDTSDAAKLAPLYTRDALMLGATGKGGWVRGRDKVAQLVPMVFIYPGYRLMPVAYREHAGRAEVEGYFARGEAPAIRYPGYFSLVLEKQPKGNWLISKEFGAFPGPVIEPVEDGAALIKMLDDAHIGRAIVFSDAYFFDDITVTDPDPYPQVRAENDWTAEQVRKSAGRLVAFCSFNPLKDYAATELRRCAAMPEFKGIKLHFGSSGVSLRNPEHLAKIKAIYALANELGLPVVAHLANAPEYGRLDSELFLNEVLPSAPNVPVIVAHLWGGSDYKDDALAVYADAVSAGDPRTKNLYFDVAQVSLGNKPPTVLRRIAERIRQIGISRILYGSDGARMGGLPPAEMWQDFRSRVPLTEAELRAIANNVLPMRP